MKSEAEEVFLQDVMVVIYMMEQIHTQIGFTLFVNRNLPAAKLLDIFEIVLYKIDLLSNLVMSIFDTSS